MLDHLRRQAALFICPELRLPIPGEVAGSEGPASEQGQSSGPRPWEALRSPEAAKAWLAAASAEELGAMARHLLVGGPLSLAEEDVRRLIELGAHASEALSRKVATAAWAASLSEDRWPGRARSARRPA